MIQHKLGEGKHLSFKDGIRNDLVYVVRGALKYTVKLQKQPRHILTGSYGEEEEERTFVITKGHYFDCFKMK